MQQLIHQVTIFKATDQLINDVQELLVQVTIDRDDQQLNRLQATLLFSRAANRLAWSHKLLNGIVWKRYMVYPPVDIVRMADLAIEDLKQVLAVENLGFMLTENNSKSKQLSAEEYQSIYNVILDRFVKLDTDSPEFKTHQFILKEDHFQALSKTLASRYYSQVYELIKFYESR